MGFTLGTKFNAGTDWEFTVSQETIAQAVQAEGGITEADIANFCYCAFIDQRVSAMLSESGRSVNDGLYPWAMEYCPVYNTNQGAHPSQLKMNVGVLDQEKVVCYERNLLTCYADIGGVTGHYLIMDIKDIKKWMVNCDSSGAFGSMTVTSTADFNGINDIIYYYDTNHVPVIEPVNAPVGTQGNLYPLNVVNINEELWIGFFTPMSHSKNLLTNEHLTHQAWDYAYSAGDIYNSNATGYIYQAGTTNYQCWCSFNDLEFPTSSGQTTGFDSYIDADGFNVIHITGQYGNNQNPFVTNCMMGNMFRTIKALHTVQSWVGLLFYDNNTLYKPIIEGGVVTGFTSDMDIPSEWDDMTNVIGNNISPTPPAPPPTGDDEDNDDPIPTVGAPYSSGLARYYVTTAGSTILNHISEAFGAWNLKDSGKDLYRNIISCKLIKSPAPIPVSGSEPFTVYGITLQYEGSDITLPVVNDNPTASFGPYNISRKFNDFRDYAPYTKVEIYLPYCGWTVLPSHVVGRSVSVTYYTDIIAATCKAVVYCNSNVVAEAAGVIGLDIPMVTENAGAKAEAVTMGLLAYGKAGLQTALGVGAAVATKGKAGVKSAVSGLENLVSAYSQTAMAFNQNYTEINGKNGDGCCIAGISAIVIKITRPKYGANTTAPYVPAEYGHSTGFVSMKSAKVSSFTGLLVADNVDTSGISGATDREKQLIKLYLESGIYVNHPN